MRTSSQVPLTLESVIVPHSHPAFEKAEEEEDDSDAASRAGGEGPGTGDYSAASDEEDPFNDPSESTQHEPPPTGRVGRAQPAAPRKRATGHPPPRPVSLPSEVVPSTQAQPQQSPPKPHTKVGGRPPPQGPAAAAGAPAQPLTPLAQSAADRFAAVEGAAREKAGAARGAGRKGR